MAKRVVRALAAVLIIISTLGLFLMAQQAFSQGQLPWLMGHAQLVVVSGSMEPGIQAGDMLIIRQQDAYQPGDIITYREGSTLVTHRIMAMAGDTLITRGDANNADDAPISTDQVEGRMVLRIPKVGSLMLWLRSTQGLTLLLVAIAGLSLISYRKRK